MKCIDPTFRTQVSVAPYTKRAINLKADERILLIGSCFSDNIGEHLLRCGMPAIVNPAGTLYNPASIAAVLRAAMSGGLPVGSVFTFQERTRCWLFPTSFSHSDPQSATELFAHTLAQVRRALLEAQTLVFTFGTAWIYEHLPTPLSDFEATVSNCHKVPAAEFARRRLSAEEIVSEWLPLLEDIQRFRADNRLLKVIFTVSPIRHFKDGAHENTLSKATLHLAVEELICRCQSGCTHILADYFPAWELLIDDLRDYRFYADDMLHPSAIAVDYIWQHFLTAYFSPQAIETLNAAERRERSVAHRPLLSV